MSKNTGTSELINYFDLGVNGDVGISGSLTLDTIANAVIDTDKFLVSDNGIIKYRTGAELLSDIGVAGNYVTIDTAQTITGAKTFSGTNLQLAEAGSADATILRNTSGDTGSTTGFNTIGFNGVNNIFVSTQNRGGFILGFNNSVQNREYTLPDASGTIALTSSIPANPVGGTGTTNYLPKFTGASTIGNSNLINDASGNLGLGVTPSPWSLGKAIEFSAGSLWALSTTDMNYMANTVYNSSLKYVNNAYALRYFQDASIGNHIWFNAPSGTAGNAITFTQAMTLTSGGNLLVGTTTDSGFKLTVGTGGKIATYRSGNDRRGLFYTDGDGTWLESDSTGNDPLLLKSPGSTGSILFYTSTTEKVRITSVGNVLIGTTTDIGVKLYVKGSAATNLFLESTGASVYQQFSNSGGNAYIGSISNDLVFLTTGAGTERMRITSGGNVLIGGTTDNGAKLQVSGSVTATNYVSNTGSTNTPSYVLNRGSASYDGVISWTDNTSARWKVGTFGTGSGDLRFFSANTGDYALTLNYGTGAATFSSSVTATAFFQSSDLRKKDIIKRENDVVYYTWKDGEDKREKVGYIAQEVQKYMPNAVNEDTDGMLSVDYIQVLVSKILVMEKEIETLKNRK